MQQPAWACNEAVEAAGAVHLHVGAVQFGKVGQFQDLGEAKGGAGAQAVRWRPGSATVR